MKQDIEDNRCLLTGEDNENQEIRDSVHVDDTERKDRGQSLKGESIYAESKKDDIDDKSVHSGFDDAVKLDRKEEEVKVYGLKMKQIMRKVN